MSEQNSPVASREAALRIALAARALNNLNVKAFVGALAEKLNYPLTENKLTKVTVEDLRGILAGDFAEQGCHVGVEPEQLKAAVRLLWGQGSEASLTPTESYSEGEMPGSLRVAVASNQGEALDGHFGSCERFLIYQVGKTAIKLIEVRSALETDGADDKNAARSELLSDCQIVYVQSIGGPAAAKVVRAGVHPIKKPEGGAARAVLAELQGRLEAPPPWLAQIMGVRSASIDRFAAALADAESDA